MVPQTKKNRRKMSIADLLQYVLNTSLVLLAIALIILLGKEIYFMITVSILNPGISIHYELLERILIFFLYFEFIAMIVKYFQEDYHFPIRYFLYIGVTAMIRFIIVEHENPMHTLLYTLAILALVIGYYIMNSVTARKGKL
jgi:protein PsiE